MSSRPKSTYGAFARRDNMHDTTGSAADRAIDPAVGRPAPGIASAVAGPPVQALVEARSRNKQRDGEDEEEHLPWPCLRLDDAEQEQEEEQQAPNSDDEELGVRHGGTLLRDGWIQRLAS